MYFLPFPFCLFPVVFLCACVANLKYVLDYFEASCPDAGRLHPKKHPCAERVLSAVAFPATNAAYADNTCNVRRWVGLKVNISSTFNVVAVGVSW